MEPACTERRPEGAARAEKASTPSALRATGFRRDDEIAPRTKTDQRASETQDQPKPIQRPAKEVWKSLCLDQRRAGLRSPVVVRCRAT
jgi:hypothetical protein